MPEVVSNIDEIRIVDTISCVHVPLKGMENFVPGQYVRAIALDSDEILPSVLFPLDWDENGMLLPAPERMNWQVGTGLKLHAPLGNGFHPPLSARRLALVDPVGSAERLFPILKLPQAGEAAIVVLRGEVGLELPEEVEALPMSALSEILDWADYIALDWAFNAPVAALSGYGFSQGSSNRAEIQVLLRFPVVCGLNAECGLCSIKTRHGWKLGCKDGPVFDWNDLEDWI